MRAVVFLVIALSWPCCGLNPFDVIRRDWIALNMRSTCRHLMRPRTPLGAKECRELQLMPFPLQLLIDLPP